MDEPTDWTRRGALGLLAMALGGVAHATEGAPGGAAAGMVDGLDPLTTYIRLRASLEPEVAIWYVRDIRYGLVGREVTPMYGIEVGVFMEAERRAADSFVLHMIEATYKTDLRTGRLLESYANPYTGREVEVRQWKPEPTRFIVTASSVQRDPPSPNLVQSDVVLSHPLDLGADIGIDETSKWLSRVPAGRKEPQLLHEWSRFRAPRAAALDPSQAACPASVSAFGLGTFQSWLGMPDHPGTQLMHGDGRKFMRVADLPRSYLDFAERRNPDIIGNPRAAVRGTPAPRAQEHAP